MTTKTQLKAAYITAEKRATPSANGVAFSVEDRVALNSLRVALRLDCSQAGELIAGGRTDRVEYQRHYARFNFWKEQVETGVIRIAPPATGEYVGRVHVTKQFDDNTFDGRIKSITDVQPAFNRAARQLIKVGVTNPHEAFKYMSTAFEVVKVEQKIDLKAERIVKELQMGDLTKDQVLATLDRVKQSF
jgi:hypothetical protein